MKKRLMTLALLCCAMTTTVVFTACSSNEDNPVNPTVNPEEELADATIMYYGHGGGNREFFYLSKLGDFYHAGEEAYKQANVVVQYKFSTAENMRRSFF